MERENSPFLLLSNGEDIVGWVCGESPDVEREWRDVPPLDRSSTRDRWDTKKTKTIAPYATESDEVPAEGISPSSN